MTYAGWRPAAAVRRSASVGSSACAAGRRRRRGSVQQQRRPAPVIGQPLRPRAAVVSTSAGRGVVEHERDPVGRVVRVERQVRGAGLEHAPAARRPGPAERGSASATTRLRADAAADQEAGQPVRPRVQLGVGQPRRPSAHDRRRVRACGAACASNSSRQRRRRAPRGGVVPLDEQPLPLGRVEDVDVADAAGRGRLTTAVEQAAASARRAPRRCRGRTGRCRTRACRAMPAGAPSRPCRAREGEQQVELGDAGADRLARDGQAGQAPGRRGGRPAAVF